MSSSNNEAIPIPIPQGLVEAGITTEQFTTQTVEFIRGLADAAAGDNDSAIVSEVATLINGADIAATTRADALSSLIGRVDTTFALLGINQMGLDWTETDLSAAFDELGSLDNYNRAVHDGCLYLTKKSEINDKNTKYDSMVFKFDMNAMTVESFDASTLKDEGEIEGVGTLFAGSDGFIYILPGFVRTEFRAGDPSRTYYWATSGKFLLRHDPKKDFDDTSSWQAVDTSSISSSLGYGMVINRDNLIYILPGRTGSIGLYSHYHPPYVTRSNGYNNKCLVYDSTESFEPESFSARSFSLGGVSEHFFDIETLSVLKSENGCYLFDFDNFSSQAFFEDAFGAFACLSGKAFIAANKIIYYNVPFLTRLNSAEFYRELSLSEMKLEPGVKTDSTLVAQTDTFVYVCWGGDFIGRFDKKGLLPDPRAWRFGWVDEARAISRAISSSSTAYFFTPDKVYKFED